MNGGLLDYITNLSTPEYKSRIIEDGIALAVGSNSSLDELEATLTEMIQVSKTYVEKEPLFREYLVMAVAAAYVGGLRDRTEFENYVITEALDKLALLDSFLDEKDISEAQRDYRMAMYLVIPTYFWSQYALNLINSRSGYQQMRRVCERDDRSCSDCIKYADQGWVNLSDGLPLPGEDCQCIVNCRCLVEYR